MPNLLALLYLAVTVVDLYAGTTGNHTLSHIFKPLLMPVLAAFFVSAAGRPLNGVHKLMLVALFFSWVGDVALMFVPVNPNYFLLGLVGFLITHVLYIITFARVSTPAVTPILPKRVWVLVPLVLYMAGLLWLLLPAIYNNPQTKPVLVPVLFYTATIATMVVFALNRYLRVSRLSFLLVFAGALMFMVSDSFIAINRFLQPVPQAHIIIMVLYTGGQYLIARGILAQFAPAQQP